MAYTRQTWNSGPSGATPVTAARLNYMEQGIQGAATTADTATTNLSSLTTTVSGHTSQLQDITSQLNRSSVYVASDLLANNGAITSTTTGWYRGLNMCFNPNAESQNLSGQAVTLHDTSGGSFNANACWQPIYAGFTLVTVGWDATTAPAAGGIRVCVQEGTSTANANFSTIGIASGYNASDGAGACGSVAFTILSNTSKYYRLYWRFYGGGFAGADGSVASNRPAFNIGIHIMQAS